jgi:hypothetical protein
MVEGKKGQAKKTIKLKTEGGKKYDKKRERQEKRGKRLNK